MPAIYTAQPRAVGELKLPRCEFDLAAERDRRIGSLPGHDDLPISLSLGLRLHAQQLTMHDGVPMNNQLGETDRLRLLKSRPV